MDENTKVTTEVEATEKDGGTTGITAEEFNAKMAEILAENKRLKTAIDKATADASSWKKKFTATQSEAEQLSMEKAEREAAIKTELEMLRKESQVNKFAKSFMAIGYSEEQAQKAAEAQFAGDTDELFRIQRDYQDDFAKQIKADLMKSMPAPSTGNDEEIQMTKEQFNQLTYSEQLKLFREHRATYDKLAH